MPVIEWLNEPHPSGKLKCCRIYTIYKTDDNSGIKFIDAFKKVFTTNFINYFSFLHVQFFQCAQSPVSFCAEFGMKNSFGFGSSPQMLKNYSTGEKLVMMGDDWLTIGRFPLGYSGSMEKIVDKNLEDLRLPTICIAS